MLMTRAQYAAHRGCRDTSVHQALLMGRIHAEPDGRIESEKADRDWDETTDVLRARIFPHKTDGLQGVQADGNRQQTTIKFLVERTERERTMVELKKLELAMRQGDLVSKRDVELGQRRVLEHYRALRNRALELPDRLSAELATETDARHIREILDRELRALFREAADAAGGEAAA